MAHQPGTCSRRGITVVEVMVALLLVSVGLLAIAGASALAVRTAGEAGRSRFAAQRAGSRVAALAAACSGQGAAELPGGFHEAWSTRPGPPGLLMVQARVAWRSPAGERAVLLQSAAPC